MCVEGLVDLSIDIPAHRTYCIVYATPKSQSSPPIFLATTVDDKQ